MVAKLEKGQTNRSGKSGKELRTIFDEKNTKFKLKWIRRIDPELYDLFGEKIIREFIERRRL